MNMDELKISSNDGAPSPSSPKDPTSEDSPELKQAESTHLSFRSVNPVNVHVNGLTVEVVASPGALKRLGGLMKKNQSVDVEQSSRRKAILNNVSAYMPSGSLTAIIGASGSGKTSMLNAISHRINDGRLKTSGTTIYNGGSRLSSIRSAYVQQLDILLPTLTVRETLQYSADLRLPPPITAEERHKIVEEVILELGLKECANTRIGNNAQKGCSGGEKRRTSLGVQMLSNPSVLFCDEVTTGLDATSAFQLVKTLKYLASKGRTIVTTIHQPRSEMWGLFDHLVLLSGGSPIYSGSTNESLPYFEDLGYELPEFVNPAEHLIDLAAVDLRSPELESTSLSRVEALKRAWKTTSENQRAEEKWSEKMDESPNDVSGVPPSKTRQASFLRQVQVQTARTVVTTWRDPLGVAGSLLIALGLGIIAGWIFYNVDESLAGIRSREGALYITAAFQSYQILLFEIYRLTSEIQLFDRESTEGVVGVFSFLVSRRLAKLFLEDIPVPLIFSVIYYFFIGFRPLASQFFTFYAAALLGHFISVTFAMLSISVSRNFAKANFLANMSFTFQAVCSGYFIQANGIPVYVRWIKYIAYVYYENSALVYNEFLAHTSNPAGQLYACPSPGGYSNPACKQYTGLYIVQSLGLPTTRPWRQFVILVAFVLGFFLLSAVFLKLKKVKMGISRARETDVDRSLDKEKAPSRTSEGFRAVNISLDNYSLDIAKHSIFGKTSKISILKPISTTFQPGILNVIMGPSGSGKTSLLNMMAHRLHSSFDTRYQAAGTMLFGGAIPTDTVVRSVVSYVSQDDDALLPFLTVRETLHFAAALRLPTWMSKRDKIQRAEAVLLKLALSGCADNLIGNELKKGISGGEKRRVTIAIQVLTDPRILLLDEPTSGLDAFTATSIIDVLRSLAEEGRTIILTIHQSRSDLFKHFGNVLLLARGGSPVYAGEGSEMVPHFSALGYDCPRTTNPADFALDLITVDLQHATKEATSREKVRSLIQNWDKRNSQPARTASQVSTPAELGSLQRKMTPFHIALPLLLRRNLISFKRNKDAIDARIMQIFGFGVVVTLFWAPLKYDYAAVQSRLGFVQQLMGLYFIGMLQNVAIYPSEKAVFYREHDDCAYSVESFFLQYLILEIPFEIVSSLFFAVLMDLAVGLPRTPELFFIVAFNCFCIVSCGESVGIMFNTLFNHTGFAVNVTSTILSIAILMAGVISVHVPVFLEAWNHLSPLKWSIANLSPYTLRGITFTCTDAQQLSDGTCPISTGQQVLELYNLDFNPGLNLLALGCCAVIYRVTAYALLKAKKTNWEWKERFRRQK